jgi:hypothetical protein
LQTQASDTEFDPKRVKLVVDGVRLMCPVHNYPVMHESGQQPVCYHHTCKLDWPRMLIQMPVAFEPAQAAALIESLPMAAQVEAFLDLERSDRAYARQLRKLLPKSVTRAAREAALVPAGAR